MRKKIGTFLTERGVITELQKQEILRYSELKGIRFGEAAMELNIITREKLLRIFGPSYKVDFFHLNPSFYPKETADWIPMDQILRFGALPLGCKKGYSLFRSKRIMNIGLLNPVDVNQKEDFSQFMKECARKQGVQEFKVFLILADHFLEVLKQVYHVSEVDLLNRLGQLDPSDKNGQIDPTLMAFIQETH